MKNFTASIGFIIAFLVGTLLITTLLGEQVAYWYLLLVLLGMVFANTDKFSELLGRFSKT